MTECGNEVTGGQQFGVTEPPSNAAQDVLPVRQLDARPPDWQRPDLLADVEAFHTKFGQEYLGKPQVLEANLAVFRHKFHQEETREWYGHAGAALIDVANGDEAAVTHRLEEMLDAGVDAVYVILGTMYKQGLLSRFEEAWKRVQRANMAKERAVPDDPRSKRDATFDIVKPEGWEPPKHSDLVEDHAHRA